MSQDEHETAAPAAAPTAAEPETETGTESHDPAVPPAYRDFMRTGWGERELDVGVRTREAAEQMIAAGATRLGLSSSREILADRTAAGDY